VEVDSAGGDGIGLIQQERGEGRYGPILTANVRVRSNVITFYGCKGETGAVADWRSDLLFAGGNDFEENIYRITCPESKHWAWNGQLLDWNQFRSAGLEKNGGLEILSR
jgi:hypothetical protein